MSFDHIDARVSDVRAVEGFYDALMPRLGFVKKQYYRVIGDEWAPSAAGKAYNTLEYHEAPSDDKRGAFFGVIEDPAHAKSSTRIAFRVASGEALRALGAELATLGALAVEPSEDLDAYPAIFFEDPLGNKLEIVAPRPANAPSYPPG